MEVDGEDVLMESVGQVVALIKGDGGKLAIRVCCNASDVTDAGAATKTPFKLMQQVGSSPPLLFNSLPHIYSYIAAGQLGVTEHHVDTVIRVYACSLSLCVRVGALRMHRSNNAQKGGSACIVLCAMCVRCVRY